MKQFIPSEKDKANLIFIAEKLFPKKSFEWSNGLWLEEKMFICVTRRDLKRVGKNLQRWETELMIHWYEFCLRYIIDSLSEYLSKYPCFEKSWINYMITQRILTEYKDNPIPFLYDLLSNPLKYSPQ